MMLKSSATIKAKQLATVRVQEVILDISNNILKFYNSFVIVITGNTKTTRKHAL